LGKTFIDRFPQRQVFCPYYTGHGIDNELRDFAKSINKWKLFLCDDGIIVHDRASYHAKSGHSVDGFALKGADALAFYNDRKKRGLIWGASFEK
jgi:hypothetical protein